MLTVKLDLSVYLAIHQTMELSQGIIGVRTSREQAIADCDNWVKDGYSAETSWQVEAPAQTQKRDYTRYWWRNLKNGGMCYVYEFPLTGTAGGVPAITSGDQ